MLCRFCGKKTDSIEQCDSCAKTFPVLLNYRSYSEDLIVKTLVAFISSEEHFVPEMTVSVAEQLPEVPVNPEKADMDAEIAEILAAEEKKRPSDSSEDKPIITYERLKEILEEAQFSALDEKFSSHNKQAPEHDAQDMQSDSKELPEEKKVSLDVLNEQTDSSLSSEKPSVSVSQKVESARAFQRESINAPLPMAAFPAEPLMPEKTTPILMDFMSSIRNQMQKRRNIVTLCICLGGLLIGAAFARISGSKDATDDTDSDALVLTETIQPETTEIPTEMPLTEEMATMTVTAPDSTGQDFISYTGDYYSIMGSVFDKNSNNTFINRFGYIPSDIEKTISIDKASLLFEGVSYTMNYYDGVLKFDDDSISDIVDEMIWEFPFDHITNGSKPDEENDEVLLYLFPVQKTKIDAVILCSRVGGLNFMEPEDDDECLLTISDGKKDAIVLSAKDNGSISLKTSYRSKLSDEIVGTAEIMTDREQTYEVVRLSPDAEEDLYLYHSFGDGTVYMVQYVMYRQYGSVAQDVILK